MKPTIFIDGECGICSRFARFVSRHDRKHYFVIDALQGDVAKKVVPSEFLNVLKTVVLVEDGVVLIKSRAVRRILSRLGFRWKMVSILMGILPRFLSDFGYDLVARFRHRLFGGGSCGV
jgi:predicted DCC family thiol-disulfide oxidoreductase YuxK